MAIDMTAHPSDQAAALNSRPRIIMLDALRGLALMGILTMNIVAFALPEPAYISPAVLGAPSMADQISWAVNFILFDGKMRGLFTLLFGASMMLIIARAQDIGRNAAAVHYRRMGWLALFGLLHFYFIWWGDILFLYAAIGMIAFLFRNMAAENLIAAALSIFVMGSFLAALLMAELLMIDTAGLASDAAAQQIAERKAMLDDVRATYHAEADIYRRGYLQILQYRLADMRWQPFAQLMLFIGEILPIMLLGMALFKNGFLSGSCSAALYRKWAMIGLGGGFIGYALLSYIAFANEFGVAIMYNLVLGWNMPFLLLMIVGYAALFVMAIGRMQRGGDMAKRILAHIAASGQTAFTNYIGISIVMTTIFYGYGLGLFGEVSRSALWLFVVGGWALMLIWPKPWLDHFQYGPLEWLWRSLARAKMQPMRKARPEQS